MSDSLARLEVLMAPAVSVEVDECVRIVGEKLELTCNVSNPDHRFVLKWQHSSSQVTARVCLCVWFRI